MESLQRHKTLGLARHGCIVPGIVSAPKRGKKLNQLVLLAWIQGRMFEKSAYRGYDSDDFARMFMRFSTLRLDSLVPEVNPCRWTLLCSRFLGSFRNPPGSWIINNIHTMRWIGFIWRIWQAKTGLSSMKIHEIADCHWLWKNEMALRKLSPLDAIEKIYEMQGLPQPQFLKRKNNS